MATQLSFCLIVFSLLFLRPVGAENISSDSNPANFHELSISENTSNLPATLNLQECYQLALKQSETIAIKSEVIREAEGRFWQSLSTALPDISFSSSDKYQHGAGGGAVPERKFSFSQPLFSGFKEFAAMSASRMEQRQRKQEKLRAQQLLFTDVSDAFYYFLNYQEDYIALETIQTALKQRVDELTKREELGRSRASEVASAQVRLNRIEADMELALSEKEVARQLLEFLTGRLIEAVVDDQSTDEPLLPRESYLVKVDMRADVLAAKESWDVAKKEVTVAKAGFWPTADLGGNYYTKRGGASEDIDWDITLEAKVPIFDGAETLGKVKETNAKERQAQLTFSETKRRAKLEIENAYTKFQSLQRRSQALSRSLDAAQRNYELHLEDYHRNLVSNLEVLQALEDLQSAKRDFISVTNEANRAYWNLQVAVGQIIL